MSVDLFVFMMLQKPANTNELQKAIDKKEIPLVLESNIDLEKHSGYLPIKTKGKESGFEIYTTTDNSEFFEHFPTVTEKEIGNKGMFVFSTGRMIECTTANYTAYVLVTEYGGKAFDPQGGNFMSPEELIKTAEQCYSYSLTMEE